MEWREFRCDTVECAEFGLLKNRYCPYLIPRILPAKLNYDKKSLTFNDKFTGNKGILLSRRRQWYLLMSLYHSLILHRRRPGPPLSGSLPFPSTFHPSRACFDYLSVSVRCVGRSGTRRGHLCAGRTTRMDCSVGARSRARTHGVNRETVSEVNESQKIFVQVESIS